MDVCTIGLGVATRAGFGAAVKRIKHPRAAVEERGLIIYRFETTIGYLKLRGVKKRRR